MFFNIKTYCNAYLCVINIIIFCFFRAVDHKIKNHSDNDSEYGKSYKKKLQKELFSHNEDGDENKLQQKEKKRKLNDEGENNESPRKKKIKLEPESDIEIPKKKKNSKYSESCGFEMRSKDSMLNDESYLNLRVKEEFRIPSPTLTKKKKKRKEINEETNGDNELSSLSTSLESKNNDTSSNDIDEISQIMDDEEEQHTVKKRKKKKMKKRKDLSEEESETVFINVQDKFSTEETIVQPCYVSNDNGYSDLTENQNAVETKNSDLNSDSGEHVNRNKSSQNESHMFILGNEVMNDDSELSTMSDQQSCDIDNVHTKSNKNQNIHDKTNPRISRLSDRIRFEEENILRTDKSDHNKNNELRSKKIEKFLKDNENLKPISSKFKSESILTQDDEIWIMKCPHDISVNAFQDISIPLDKKCKIKVDGSTYEGSTEGHINTVTVVSQLDNQFVLKNLSSKGIINFRKRVPKVHIRDDIMMLNNQTDFIPLPETKIRHPLFGSNYKKAIKIPRAVKERLEANPSISEESKKANKQKKKKILSIDNDFVSNVETKHEPQLFGVNVVKKKNKKRKHSGSEETQSIKQDKRQKHHTNSAEVWDSEKAIEENLFNF